MMTDVSREEWPAKGLGPIIDDCKDLSCCGLCSPLKSVLALLSDEINHDNAATCSKYLGIALKLQYLTIESSS
jgi:hypothetical protein